MQENPLIPCDVHSHVMITGGFRIVLKEQAAVWKPEQAPTEIFRIRIFFFKQMETFYFIFSTKYSAHIQKVLVWCLIHWNTIYLVTSWHYPFYVQVYVSWQPNTCVTEANCCSLLKPINIFYSNFHSTKCQGSEPLQKLYSLKWLSSVYWHSISSFFLSVYIFLSL